MTETQTYQSHCDSTIANRRYWTGGAVIETKRFCFPFAEMDITPDEVVLRIGDCTRYAFKPWQISKIELCPCSSPGVVPAAALKICHQVKGYPEEIVFLLFCYSPEPFLDRLRSLKFGKN